MHKLVPTRILLGILFLCTILFESSALSQNEGIGTFSQLVDKTVENAPTPTPTPTPRILATREFEGKETAAATPCETPFFSAPTAGLEYDYRRIQKKGLNGLGFDVNEAHGSFAFSLSTGTKVSFDYFHVWSDGSNDVGTSQTSDANGIRLILQQNLLKNLILALPFVFKEEDADGVGPTGPNGSVTDAYVFNPFLVYFFQPWNQKRLTLFVSSGYRAVITNTTDSTPVAPDINGWNGTYNLLGRADYALTEKVTLSGNATWNHLTNFYLSKTVPRPDDNTFALGATVTFNIGEIPAPCPGGKAAPRMTFAIGYQYDGFNRDYYQHSITIAGTYRFW